MSHKRQRAIQALRRWRAVEESAAANMHQSRLDELVEAEAILKSAQADATRAGEQYGAATGSGLLDLDRVTQLGAIGDLLRLRVQQADQVAADRMRALGEARDAYAKARTHSRLVSDRAAELAKELADEHEKRMFDQTADMLVARTLSR